MAELRSGGQIDSGSESVPFQITNGHLGEQLPCQLPKQPGSADGQNRYDSTSHRKLACHPGPRNLRAVGPMPLAGRLHGSFGA